MSGADIVSFETSHHRSCEYCKNYKQWKDEEILSEEAREQEWLGQLAAEMTALFRNAPVRAGNDGVLAIASAPPSTWASMSAAMSASATVTPTARL